MPRRFRGIVAPLRRYTPAQIADAIREWVESRMVIAYTDDRGEAVLAFTGFSAAQPGKAWYKKEGPSRFGEPPNETLQSTPEWLREVLQSTPEYSRAVQSTPEQSGATEPEVADPSLLQRTPENSGELRVMEGNGREEKKKQRAHGGAHTREAASSSAASSSGDSETHGDNQRDTLVKAIKEHQIFSRLNAEEIADAHLHWVMTGGKRVEWLVTAVGQCARRAASAKAAGEAWPPGLLADRLSRYLDKAKRPPMERWNGRYDGSQAPTGAIRSVDELKDTGTAPPMAICVPIQPSNKTEAKAALGKARGARKL
jgi:hypothetical protein